MTFQNPKEKNLDIDNKNRFAKQAMKQIEKFEGNLIAYRAANDKKQMADLEAALDDAMALLIGEIEELERRGSHKEIRWIKHEYERYKHSRSDEDYVALGQDLRTVKQLLQEIQLP